MSVNRCAAIDIGTVTCRMLVADVDGEGLHELDRECRIVNLGEGVDRTGFLEPEAMRRTVEAVTDFRDLLETFRTAERARIDTFAFATSAARDATNSDEFVKVLADAGIQLSIIPGEREAALSFLGASCDFPDENLYVVDIGGGSTEVAVGRAGGPPLRSCSFDIGCRRMTEKFLSCDPPSEGELEAVCSWVERGMREFFESVRDQGFLPDRLVAVAGTATTVVSVSERMESYDPRRVHRSVVTRGVLDETYRMMAGMKLADRRHVVGLDPERAPVIVAGLAILRTILDLAGVESFTVSESDILQGVLLDAVQR